MNYQIIDEITNEKNINYLSQIFLEMKLKV